MSIAAGKFESRYEANVKPCGKDSWDVLIEEVKYEPSSGFEVLRSTTQSFKYAGNEDDCKKTVSKILKTLIDDRDAMESAAPFTITEQDVLTPTTDKV